MSQGMLEDVLPDSEGWVPIITKAPDGGLRNFRWFEWPKQKIELAQYVQRHAHTDVYFSPMLFTRPPTNNTMNWATKANVTKCAVVTVDGDDMDPADLLIPPTTIVWTSRNHWQGYWRISDWDDEEITKFMLEDLSHGMYDRHKDQGMDSGWQLAVKRRLPFTKNTKAEHGIAYDVNYTSDLSKAVSYADMTAPGMYVPHVPMELKGIGAMPAPNQKQVADILNTVGSTTINELFMDVPIEDWSSKMYQLECRLWEAGVSLEDSFLVVNQAACNKFARDGRSQEALWKQLNMDKARWEAESGFLLPETIVHEDLNLPRVEDATLDGLYWSGATFIHHGEHQLIPTNTFLDVFVKWAQSRSTQSPWEFNVAGAAALLSTTLSRYAKLPMSFGDVPLNLYFMVLGRTTQSRKTTSLTLARSILECMVAQKATPRGMGEDEEENVYWLPENTTPEALIDCLNGLPRQSTILAIDEWQETLKACAKPGSYMSGLLGMLTEAYGGDIPGVMRKSNAVKRQKGVKHYLTFYGTGIFNQTADALTVERIESGFVPRTIVVVDSRTTFTPGADDVKFLKGDEQKRLDTMRSLLAKKLLAAVNHWETKYVARATVSTGFDDPRYNIECDDDAFDRWQKYAYELGVMAANHPTHPKSMFPICDRLALSVLKLAGLLALVELEKTIRMKHILKAISVADTWVKCVEILVNEVNNNGFAKIIRDIESYVSDQPDGQVRYELLLSRFQSKFDDPRKLKQVLEFCQQKGTLRDIITNTVTKERVIRYVRR